MNATSVNTIPAPLDPSAPVGKKELEREDFMTLFITQLQYQDPMKPMDSYEMASQLAQFSSMEATMKMSESMDDLLAYQTSQNNLQLLGLLDKNVQALGNMTAVSGGAATATEFALVDTAASCVVEIYDEADHLVRTIDLGRLSTGTHELAWDGTDYNGAQVADGAYQYVVRALDDQGEPVTVDYRTSGKVTGVEFVNGQASLTLDNQLVVDVGDVIRVK